MTIPKPPSPADLAKLASCQHHLIDNATAQCRACGEAMIGITLTARTVLSAPNVNPCRDPEHLRAIAAGEYVECDQPYVPGRVRTVVVGADPVYECNRCQHDGTSLIQGEPFVPDCGHDHRGHLIREGDSFKGVGR